MSKASEKVKSWRKNTKKRIIEAMGGKCCICGYNKCQSALALHHIDPSKKDMSFGSIRANPKNWKTIIEELRKCVLVCHVCHSEIHEKITFIPANAPLFNEKFADYKKLEKENELTPCPVCGVMKISYLKNCSLKCAGKSRFKVDWDKIDIQKELKTKSIVQLANELNCSDMAVRKRMKKLNIKK